MAEVLAKSGLPVDAYVDLTTMNCCNCGGTYALNERYRRERQEKGGSWHCPYCNTSLSYTESEVAKLKKKLDEKQKALMAEAVRHDQTAAELKHTERRRRAEKGQRNEAEEAGSRGDLPSLRCSVS